MNCLSMPRRTGMLAPQGRPVMKSAGVRLDVATDIVLL